MLVYKVQDSTYPSISLAVTSSPYDHITSLPYVTSTTLP